MVTVDLIGFLITMRLIVFLIIAHCVGDYLFQSTYLAVNKGENKYLLFVHGVLYVFGIILTAHIFSIEISVLQILALFITHVITDHIKASGISTEALGEKKALIIDQAIHYLVLFLVFYL